MKQRSPVACSIAAKNCLPLVRVLAESWRRHHPEIPFCVLLADEVQDCFDPAREPFTLIPLASLAIPDADAFRFRYAQQPLSYAATPFLIRHLLQRGHDRVIFLKQESLVLGRFDLAFAQLEEASILLTPHLVAPLNGSDAVSRELNILQSGAYNIGFVGVAATPEANAFLEWWQDHTARHCLHAVASGMHYEQRWIDFAPAYFPGVRILRDAGYNVAHWNLPDRQVDIADGTVFSNGRPSCLFRFSGFDADVPDATTRYSNRLGTASLNPAVASIFSQYRNLLLAAGHAEARQWPYAYGTFDNGVPIPNVARDLYSSLGDATAEFGNPFTTSGTNSFFRWLSSPAVTSRYHASLTRLWLAIHVLRIDLQTAFSDPLGKDLGAFAEWADSTGRNEHGISDAFPARVLPAVAL